MILSFAAHISKDFGLNEHLSNNTLGKCQCNFIYNTVFHACMDLIPDTLRYGAYCDYIHSCDRALLILKLTNYSLEAFVVLDVI